MTNGDGSLVMSRIDNDDSPMKHWLDRYGVFLEAEDNYEAWRLLWKVFNGTSYVVHGTRDEDPVYATYLHVKEALWNLCE